MSTWVDREAPLRFIRTVYEQDDWVAVFLKSYETGHTTQRVGPVSLVADARFQAWLRWRYSFSGFCFLMPNRGDTGPASSGDVRAAPCR